MNAPETRTRILDAALARLGEVGIARLALDDVATDAGFSRQTVYRHFDNRDGLLAAVVLREEEVFLDTIRAAVAGCSDLEEALAAAMRTGLRMAAEHPLLNRLLDTEPEALLPLLTTGAGPVLPAARPVVRDLLARFAPSLDDATAELVADVAARTLVSYATNPPSRGIEPTVTVVAAVHARGVVALLPAGTTA